MGIFTNLATMHGGGNIAVMIPGITPNVSTTYNSAFTQHPCIFRITGSSNTTTSYVVVSIITQYSQPGQVITQVEVSLENSKTQYIDIADVIRSGLLRSNVTATVTNTGTVDAVIMEEFDNTDTSLGTRPFRVLGYDAVEQFDTRFVSPLPDTFRMIDDPFYAIKDLAACTRQCDGYKDIQLYDANGASIGSLTGVNGDNGTYGWGFDTTNKGVLVAVKGKGGTIAARVQWLEPCGNLAMLRWWSPVYGGWKSCAIKLRGGGYTVNEKTEYVTMFDTYGARSGKDSMAASIENCTPNDVAYYSDLYLSDEVYLIWDAYNQYYKRMTVEGTPPSYGRNGYTDMEFDLKLWEVSTLC